MLGNYLTTCGRSPEEESMNALEIVLAVVIILGATIQVVILALLYRVVTRFLKRADKVVDAIDAPKKIETTKDRSIPEGLIAVDIGRSPSNFSKGVEGRLCNRRFNVNNMEIIQAITEAVKEEKAPVILQFSEGARKIRKARLSYAPRRSGC
jgi:hypothetical protein